MVRVCMTANAEILDIGAQHPVQILNWSCRQIEMNKRWELYQAQNAGPRFLRKVIPSAQPANHESLQFVDVRETVGQCIVVHAQMWVQKWAYVHHLETLYIPRYEATHQAEPEISEGSHPSAGMAAVSMYI